MTGWRSADITVEGQAARQSLLDSLGGHTDAFLVQARDDGSLEVTELVRVRHERSGFVITHKQVLARMCVRTELPPSPDDTEATVRTEVVDCPRALLQEEVRDEIEINPRIGVLEDVVRAPEPTPPANPECWGGDGDCPGG